ncbi:MAG: hypothetical protein D6814_05105 [Calditrichaeota bacterium]|nr:MAG: hypothetical protein D6814_05105 [Calditrichota bacterium]
MKRLKRFQKERRVGLALPSGLKRGAHKEKLIYVRESFSNFLIFFLDKEQEIYYCYSVTVIL